MFILDLFSYSFVVRALEAGVIVALIAPLIGVFLVLRRYSLIADTLAHVSLAGLAIGALLGVNPLIAAIGTTLLASLGIEKLRSGKQIYGESALALFLSGSLALAVVLLGLAHNFTTNLLNYLFGSIVTVTANDIVTMAILAIVVVVVLALFYKELLYVTFDEASARVAGIPTKLINTILIILAAFTVALAIPIVGVLLIAALMVIPALTALQLKQNLWRTILWAEVFSIVSVIGGIIASFYLNLATGGTIVLLMLIIFIGVLFVKK